MGNVRAEPNCQELSRTSGAVVRKCQPVLTRTLHSGACRAGESRICVVNSWGVATPVARSRVGEQMDHHPSPEGEPARACHPNVSPPLRDALRRTRLATKWLRSSFSLRATEDTILRW